MPKAPTPTSHGFCAQVAKALEQGAADLRLTVWGFNEPARRLYEELGFETRASEMGKRLTDS